MIELKANIIQNLRNKEGERKNAKTVGLFKKRSHDIKNDLAYIKLLTRKNHMNEMSS